jgi:hypothetical protein
MAQAAYLRSYVPERMVDDYLEHVGGTAAGGPLVRGEFGLYRESCRDDAFVVEREGRRYVCPRYPRLRMLEGLLAFRNSYPGAAASVLVPPALAERAAGELDRIQRGDSSVRSHILTSPFHVPLRWFAAFEASERELSDGPRGVTIHYWTKVGKARRRLQRAIDVLEEADFDDAVVEEVQDLIRWLRPFPRQSLLQLDYGDVADLFDETELALDESAADVAASLDALERGDFEASGVHYGRVAARWAHAQSLVFAN